MILYLLRLFKDKTKKIKEIQNNGLNNFLDTIIPMHNFKHRLLFFTSHLILISIFSLIYYLLYYYDETSFTNTLKNKKTMTYFDFLYFSLTTQTTVGYGDIHPTTHLSRTFNMIQLLFVYISVVFVL